MNERLRQQICLECARIMAEEGVRDFQQAKRKAQRRLNVRVRGNLPTNSEIQAALDNYLNTFQLDALSDNFEKRIALALDTMKTLAEFEPRLVGALTREISTAYTPVEIHVFADEVEDIGFFLDEHGIPAELVERRIRYSDERVELRPVYCFEADGIAIELSVFPRIGLREAPKSPIDGRPMRRLGLRDVAQLNRSA